VLVVRNKNPVSLHCPWVLTVYRVGWSGTWRCRGWERGGCGW